MPTAKKKAYIQKLVQNSIQEGRFVPFVGAGVSSIRPQVLKDSPWRSVGERIDFLSAYFRTMRCSAEANYVESQRRIHEIGDPLRPKAGRARTTLRGELEQFQVALVRLSSALVGLFGNKMVIDRTCVADLRDYRVALTADDRRELAPGMLDVVTAAKRLADAMAPHGLPGGQDGYRFEALSVDQHLRDFARGKCGDMFSGPATLNANQRELARQLALEVNPDEVDHELRLDELAWLEDLLWYSIRYDVQAYPTTTELTFYLSLFATGVIRRSGLPEVAELHPAASQCRAIKKWLSHCEGGYSPCRTLHLAIAAALWFQFGGRDGARNDGPGADARLPSVLFSTNYDRAIERALEALPVGKHAYHVIFPVAATHRGGLSSPAVIWLFATHQVIDANGSAARSEITECTKWTSEEFLSRLAGPVLIKLHGSPLESLEASELEEVNRRCKTGYSKLAHHLVLSESSYLFALLGIPDYPQWMQNILSPERDLWFLGYSIGDWNVRMRLVHHIIGKRDKAQEELGRQANIEEKSSGPHAPSHRVAFDRHFDVLKLGILGTLNITQFEGELRDFGSFLMDLPEIGEWVRSAQPTLRKEQRL